MFKKSIIFFVYLIFMVVITLPCLSEVTWTNYNYNNTGGKLGSNQVYAIAVDPNSDGKIVWFGLRPVDDKGWEGGLSKLDTETGQWTHFTTSNSQIPHNRVWDIDFDSEGNMWIGTHGGGLAKFDGVSNFTVYDNASTGGKIWNRVYEIAIDSQGNLWCSGGPETNDVGLSVTDRKGNWAVYSTKNSSLSQNAVYGITFDKDGNKWFGTRDNGVDKLDDMGTPFDLNDGDVWTHYSTSSGLQSNNINSGSVDCDLNGNIWVGYGTAGTEDGCSKFDGNTWTTYLLGDARVRCTIHDSQGYVWIGDKGGETSTGLHRFDGTNWENWTEVSTGQQIDWINKIALDEKNDVMWIGTHGNGVFKAEGLIPTEPVNVSDIKELIVSDFNLYQNFPNPFNPVTKISYSVPVNSKVTLKIYSVTGQLIRTLIDEQQSAGFKSVFWEGRNDCGKRVTSGVYLYEINVRDFRDVKSMVIVK